MLNTYCIAQPTHFSVSRAQFSLELLLYYMEGSFPPRAASPISLAYDYRCLPWVMDRAGIRIPIVTTNFSPSVKNDIKLLFISKQQLMSEGTQSDTK